jgi:hypothetical protein
MKNIFSMQPLTEALPFKFQSGSSIAYSLRIVAPVLFVATLAALLHFAPYWRAQSLTPPGWTFTGNISLSPDMMQYRIWSRQSQKDGILISNTLTTEPNKPHLPVVFYYLIGQISRSTGLSPEWVYAYAGSLFAFGLSILLFIIIRHFLKLSSRAWWVFLVILIGGGFGAHLLILSQLGIVNNNIFLHRIFVESISGTPVFEHYRSNYVFISLFDTHYLLIWLMTTVAIFSLHFTLREVRWRRIILTAFLYITATLLQLYQGVTLITITAGVLFLCWRKGLLNRSRFMVGLICSLAAAGCMIWQMLLYRSSGLPMPTWRALNIMISILLISYPVAWLLIAWGVADYWRQASFNECFLLGWALGCTVLTLSGPFYPYPDRGTMTLQIPIYIIAGSIYFARYRRVTPLAVLLAILILGATPAWALRNKWVSAGFSPSKPYMFLSAEHREMVDLLKRHARENDVLILDKSRDPWRTDDLWLAPQYPGKLYCGHFFLTVDYDRKCAEVNRFFRDTPEGQSTFLQEHGIRHIYVEAKDDPGRFERIPGLVLLKAASIGSLFEYTVK